MNNVVNTESNNNDDSHRLTDSQLPSFENHDGNNPDNDDGHTEEGHERLDEVASSNQQHGEGEKHGDDDALDS